MSEAHASGGTGDAIAAVTCGGRRDWLEPRGRADLRGHGAHDGDGRRAAVALLGGASRVADRRNGRRCTC